MLYNMPTVFLAHKPSRHQSSHMLTYGAVIRPYRCRSIFK